MKKNLLFILLLLFSIITFAQESNDKIIYLDSLDVEVSFENYFYKKVIKDYSLEKNEYKFYKYNQFGKIYQEGFLDKKDEGKLINEIINYFKNGNKKNATYFVNGKPLGKVEEWYENGNKKEDAEFINDELETGKSYKIINFWDENKNQLVINGNGIYKNSNKYFSENGTIKEGFKDGIWSGKSTINSGSYTENYEIGKFISGKTIDKQGNEIEYLIKEIKPEPKKGIADFYKFIGKNFRYSRESEKLNSKGKIIIEFVVDATGKIVEPKIIKGLGHGLDEEAIRVLLKYEDWIPGKQRGLNVRVKYSIPIVLQGFN